MAFDFKIKLCLWIVNKSQEEKASHFRMCTTLHQDTKQRKKKKRECRKEKTTILYNFVNFSLKMVLHWKQQRKKREKQKGWMKMVYFNDIRWPEQHEFAKVVKPLLTMLAELRQMLLSPFEFSMGFSANKADLFKLISTKKLYYCCNFN